MLVVKMRSKLLIWIYLVSGCVGFFLLQGSPDLAAQTTATLANQLKQIVDSVNLKEGKLGVYIVEVDTGREIFDYNGDLPLIPASCNKLLTTAAALYYLGADFTYKTQIFYTGEIKGAVLNGNIVVIGTGDPTISGRFHPQGNTKDLVWVFRQWADSIKKLGIRNIYGDVIGDDDYFDDEYCAKGWPLGERGEWYCAEISALSFNDNCVDIEWQGANTPGKLAFYKLNPLTDYVTMINSVTTVEKNGKLSISYSREDKTNIIKANGTIPIEKKSLEWATIYNPTLYFVTVIKETLERSGIVVKGKAVDADMLKDKEEVLKTRQFMDCYVSPQLASIIKVINENSQNFYAEQLLKTLGKIVKDEGSFAKGGLAVIEFLEKEKIYVPGTVVVDGSGLSRLNRVSARQLVNILQFMGKHPSGKQFFDSLPQGGVSGTLRKRFQQTVESQKAAERIRGKTGYIGGVNSLTGIIQTKQGQKVYYSIIVNADNISSDERIKLIDNIALTIAKREYL